MSEETETVAVTLTVELPKKVHVFLERFAQFLGVPLEEILKRELQSVVPDFYQSETFQNNIELAIKNHGCAKYFQVDC